MSGPISEQPLPETVTWHVTDKPLEGTVVWKVALRLIPFLFLLYVANILDRVNVSFARLQMLDDLQMGEEVYSWGASIFYIGYVLLEVPSNLIMHRTGARMWIGRIMISWGIISAAMMFVRGPWSFYLLRFLLGVAEAGFFPGIILYLSYWFSARERARAVACFFMASPFAGIVGNPLSGALLQYMDTRGGLAGWQWLFLVEGIPSVLLGVIVWFYLTDRPEQARWLGPGERAWLTARMSREEAHREQHHSLSRLRALTHPRVWLLIALYFTIAVASNAFGFYLPAIVDMHFSGQSKFQIGLLSAIPSLAAVIIMLLVGSHSDRTGERRWHVAVPAFVATVGWWMIAFPQSPWLVMVALSLAQVGAMTMIPTFWSVPTAFLSGTAAAGGIALINSVGNLGGFLGINIFGRLKAATDSFTVGSIAVALIIFLGGILALCVRHDRTSERQPE